MRQFEGHGWTHSLCTQKLSAGYAFIEVLSKGGAEVSVADAERDLTITAFQGGEADFQKSDKQEKIGLENFKFQEKFSEEN